MLRSSFGKKLVRSGGWLGGALLLAVVSLSLRASTVTVDFGITLNGLSGTGEFVYDPSLAVADSGGQYVNGAGLESFDLTYDLNNYTLADALDAPALPEVTLPGN